MVQNITEVSELAKCCQDLRMLLWHLRLPQLTI